MLESLILSLADELERVGSFGGSPALSLLFGVEEGGPPGDETARGAVLLELAASIRERRSLYLRAGPVWYELTANHATRIDGLRVVILSPGVAGDATRPPLLGAQFPPMNGGRMPVLALEAETVSAACAEVDELAPLLPWWLRMRAAASGPGAHHSESPVRSLRAVVESEAEVPADGSAVRWWFS